MMRDAWNTLLERLMPSRRDPDERQSHLLLHLAILALIAIASGPELAAYFELRVLLELLGVVLFTTAFIAGARLVMFQLAVTLREMLVPAMAMSVLRGPAGRFEWAAAGTYIVMHGAWWLGFFTVCIAWVFAIRDFVSGGR
jgi:hypothetical protein